MEPVVLARKPLAGTVAANVLKHGTGALNVDGCRVGIAPSERSIIDNRSGADDGQRDGIYQNGVGRRAGGEKFKSHTAGRWPANVILDEDAAAALDAQSGTAKPKPARTGRRGGRGFGLFDHEASASLHGHWPADAGGGASRFFYVAKAGRRERGDGNTHATVKPLALMRYLVRLVTPPGGLVLDPFAGSGTTLLAAREEGFRAVGVELEREHCAIIRRRLKANASGR